MRINSPECLRIREEMGSILSQFQHYDDRPSGRHRVCDLTEEQKTLAIMQILSIKGLAILADDQSLAEIIGGTEMYKTGQEVAQKYMKDFKRVVKGEVIK